MRKRCSAQPSETDPYRQAAEVCGTWTLVLFDGTAGLGGL